MKYTGPTEQEWEALLSEESVIALEKADFPQNDFKT